MQGITSFVLRAAFREGVKPPLVAGRVGTILVHFPLAGQRQFRPEGKRTLGRWPSFAGVL